MIELKHIDIGFAQKQCITDGSFCARDGQITVICGESGTGKSALLNLIAMLDQKNTCEYMHQGKLLQLSASEKERFRNQHMSYITQHALLFAHNTVLDNLKFYLRDDDADKRAEELLRMAGLIEERKKCVRLLSGGERQRLAVLCALAADREIILGDEITAALDQENKAIVRRLMRQCADEGKTVILVTHDEEVTEMADRVYQLSHCELQLRKQTEEEPLVTEKKTPEAISADHIDRHLFFASRKRIFPRILISVIIALIFFAGANVIRTQLDLMSLTAGRYSLQTLSDRQITIWNDPQKTGTQDQYHPAFSADIQEKIRAVDHLIAVYDYYTFGNDGLSKEGSWNEMSISAARDDQPIEERALSDELAAAGYSHDFTVIPYYDEEDWFKQEENGVYVNEDMAYMYQLEEGDTLYLEAAVPYACAQTIDDTPTIFYYTELVPLELNVLGIVDRDRGMAHDNLILMSERQMSALIQEQEARYQRGELVIDQTVSQGYSVVAALQTGMQIGFADQFTHVLPVIDELKQIDDTVAAECDYIERAQINDRLDEDWHAYYALMAGVIVIAVLGGAILQGFYVRTFKADYLLLRVIGTARSIRHRAIYRNGLLQVMLAVLSAVLIYALGLLIALIADGQGDVMMSALSQPGWLSAVYAFSSFSWIHFILFFVLSVLCIVIVTAITLHALDRKDLIKWMRDSNDQA